MDTKLIHEGFNKYWKETLGNYLTPEISRNNLQNIEVFNKAIYNNQSNTSTTKYIIPSATGTGKTQLTGFYLANTLQKSFRSLVVVERTSGADELLDTIRNLIAPINHKMVNTYHSATSSTTKTLQEATDSQVLIITHKRFSDMLLENAKLEFGDKYSYLVADRDLIVVDEAISTIEEISISKNSLYRTVAELRGLQTLVPKVDKEKYLAEVNLLEILANDLTRHYDNPILDTDIMPYAQQMDDKDIADSSEVLGLCMLMLKDKPQMVDEISKIHKVFNSNIQYLFKKGGDIYIKTVEEIIPNKSLVVLDATATVNKVYSYYTKHYDNIELIPKIDCRRYENVNIHTFTTSTGKSTILPKAVEVAKCLAKSIQDNTKDTDKVLIVVHKELENALISYLGEHKNILVNHWGNLTGTNSYNDCNKIFVYGLFHKPLNVHYNNYRLSGNQFNLDLMLDEEERIRINELEKYDVASELIQAINRIRIRKVVDNKGNCDSADIYLTLPSGDHIVKDMLLQELAGATISDDWSVSKTLKKVDRLGNTQALIKILDEFRVQGKLTVTRDEARELIDSSKEYKNVFRMNLGQKTTKTALQLAGYEMCKIPQVGYRGKTKQVNGFRYVG